MEKESKTRVESRYQSKEERVLIERFRNKIAQLICKKPDKAGMKYRMKS